MTVGFNYNQAILAGTAPPSPMPYSPSYSVPIQSGPQPLRSPAMKVDNYESTRDKSAGDFVGGFFSGAAKSIYGMGEGLVFLGKSAAYGITSPVSAAKTVGRTALHIATHPWQTTQSIAKGIVKPYSTALQQGQYGEALGRLTVDLAVVTAAFAEKPPAPGPTEPPPTVLTPEPPPIFEPPPVVSSPVAPVGGGGASNSIVNDIKDVLLDNVGNGNINGNNNTINIIIGGGTQTASSAGGGLGAAANTAANVADDAGRIANGVGNIVNETGSVVDDVAKAAQTTAQTAAQTAGTAAQFTAQGSTIGTQIGQGIDYVLSAPAKITNGIGNAVSSVGRGIQKVGNAILNPLDTLKGINPVSVTEWVANGIRNGGNAVANGMIYAAHNPQQALIVAGAVGRGGKAAEDILSEMDIVR
jgi:hypothetical protein